MFVCNVFGSNLKLNGNSLIEIYLITQRSFAEGCKNRQTKKTNELLLFCKLLMAVEKSIKPIRITKI